MSEPQSGVSPSTPTYRAPPPRKRPLWRTLLWIVVAIVVALGLAFLLTPHGKAKGGKGGRRPPTVVGTATATKGDIPIQLMELGTVTPEANVTVHTRIAGTLMKIYFQEGQMVHEGDLLALVDPRPYQVALEQAEGQLARDQASLADAQLDLKRYRTLASQDSIARQQVDTQAATVKQDQGVVKSDQASVDSAKLNLIYCHITAPVSGRVGLRQVDAGNYVQTGDTNGIVVITTLDPIDVLFSVPEDNVPQISERIASGAVLSATALDRTGATTLAQGTLSTLDNQIDTTTGTVKAKARFANGDGGLYPNQFVNLSLLVDTVRDAVIVPTAAIRHGPNGDFVYTVDQIDETAKMTTVKVGQADGERTAIVSGVQVGDVLVTEGGDRLSDGAQITLASDAASLQKAGARQKKPAGFFGWLSGLFGKAQPSDQGGGQASGRSSSPAQSAAGSDQVSQGGGSGGGSRHGGGGGARMSQMVSQLNLDPDQTAKAKTIFADMRQKIMASGGDPDARHQAMQEAFGKLDAILTPDQKAKFAQLRAQMGHGHHGGGAGQGGGADNNGGGGGGQ